MFEAYKGKIVHIFGAIDNFVGEIETADHPNGPGWIRINNPAITIDIREKNRIDQRIGVMGGPGFPYERWVDIYIPPGESMIEIRSLDPEGPLMKAYKLEIGRTKVRHIILPI